MSTKKIADVIGAKLLASVIDINVNSENVSLDNYDLVGFGAGIAAGKHYSKMLKYVEKLLNVQNKSAFIFSTSGMYNEKKMLKNHKVLKDLLLEKGFTVVDEFGCKGFFYLGFKFLGINKKNPDGIDLKNVELFAERLLK